MNAVLPPLRLGPLTVEPPVVLAPMAGVTNAPFRRLCRRYGGGLYVSEMITARALIEGNAKTARMVTFGPDEVPRSLQLYGTDPAILGEAVRRLVGEGRVDHIDLNFGCPAPKVTRRGGGAALPVKRRLLRDVVRACVRAAEPAGVPVTMKFRMGVDERVLTFLEAGRIGEDEGVAAVALHARTAEQLYSGHAAWAAIGELKAAVSAVPVLGNGDIWEAADALAMVAATGCDGVVIGRGCLGRPWLFADLEAAFTGKEPGPSPRLGEVATVMADHARLLVEHHSPAQASGDHSPAQASGDHSPAQASGDHSPAQASGDHSPAQASGDHSPAQASGDHSPAQASGLRDFRKHTGWYLTGYPVGPEIRRRLANVDTLAELDDLLAVLDPDLAVIPGGLRIRRGHTNGPRPVHLPHRWLDDPDDATPLPAEADALVSGG